MNWIEKAQVWYERHTGHVNKIVGMEKSGFEFKPSDEDLNHPDLWKPQSWKWFEKQGHIKLEGKKLSIFKKG
jgi:hypothetical protein